MKVLGQSDKTNQEFHIFTQFVTFCFSVFFIISKIMDIGETYLESLGKIQLHFLKTESL